MIPRKNKILGIKYCPSCVSNKNITDFYKDRHQSGGFKAYCKTCVIKQTTNYNRKNFTKFRIYQDNYYKNNKPIFQKIKWKEQGIKISIHEYNQLLIRQHNKCAICKKPQYELKKLLCVDHNHVTGQIRGLLCDICNRIILPVLEKYANNIDAAKEYLKVENICK